MSVPTQGSLFRSPEREQQIEVLIVEVVSRHHQPSARELLEAVEQRLGLEARWDLMAVVARLAQSPTLTRANRDYLRSLIDDGSLAHALRGDAGPDRERVSTIDELLRQSRVYRSSEAFREMVEFMSGFRDYAPYNNMLVRLQNPGCSFFATEADWRTRFNRNLKDDARPMLILAPMHPVMLVYDLDETEGPPLPEELKDFARFEGAWQEEWLTRMLENAARFRIRVDFKALSSTLGGFATLARGNDSWKMRIAVHDALDGASRFGVLCHELGHIFLGHLGADSDLWWPGRANLDGIAVEIEAEAAAFIVTRRLGLKGSSAAYLSRYLTTEKVPSAVSMESIARVAGHIERMARESIPAPRRRTRQRG